MPRDVPGAAGPGLLPKTGTGSPLWVMMAVAVGLSPLSGALRWA